MSKLDRSVGTRAISAAAPVKHEIPKDAIAEIIVNAVAHRDYTSTATVQVFVFADRVEVWNPGHLPKGMTPEQLSKPHSSEPPNPFIARPLYLVHYIENLGTGTLDVIRYCHESNLPEPDFEQRGNQFVVTLWRDWLKADVITSLRLNERQLVGLNVLKIDREITTMAYQQAVGGAKRTAVRDLDDLLAKGVVQRTGAGRTARYILSRNRAINVPIVPSSSEARSPLTTAANRAINVPIVPPSTQAKPPHRKRKGEKKGEIAALTSQARSSTTEKAIEKTTPKTTQKTTSKTTQKILHLIAQKPDITRQQMAEVLGITDNGVKYHLRQMQQKNLIRRVGSDKGGHWKVVR